MRLSRAIGNYDGSPEADSVLFSAFSMVLGIFYHYLTPLHSQNRCTDQTKHGLSPVGPRRSINEPLPGHSGLISKIIPFRDDPNLKIPNRDDGSDCIIQGHKGVTFRQ